MALTKKSSVIIEKHTISSSFLKRDVVIDCYIPMMPMRKEFSLLLINDGQDLPKMPFDAMLSKLMAENKIEPIFCVGIYCAPDRKNEYGTALLLDYKGRGAKAMLFNFFVMQELLPYLRAYYDIYSFKDKSFAGFSLGGLCAMDMVWNHAVEFKMAGIFSGSFWWRDRGTDDPLFDEETDRIMHKQVREGKFKPWLKFFFEVGTQDEKGDRNNNGIIDSIDDTVSLINELYRKGYSSEDVAYLQLEEGRHDVPTWGKAFPVFLVWGFGITG